MSLDFSLLVSCNGSTSWKSYFQSTLEIKIKPEGERIHSNSLFLSARCKRHFIRTGFCTLCFRLGPTIWARCRIGPITCSLIAYLCVELAVKFLLIVGLSNAFRFPGYVDILGRTS